MMTRPAMVFARHPRLSAAIVAVSFFCGRAWAGSGEPACRGCDIVLVTIDVLRGDEVKAGGAKSSIMPNLEALASRGVSFSNAFSQAPDTLASTLSIWSGLYPWHHGVVVPVRDEASKQQWLQSSGTLVDTLRRRGYEIGSASLDASGIVNEMQGKEPFEGGPLGMDDLTPDKRFLLLLRGDVHDPYLPGQDAAAQFAPTLSAADYPTRQDVLNCEILSAMAGKTPADLITGEFKLPAPAFVPKPRKRVLTEIVEMTDPKARLAAVRRFDPVTANYVSASACYWSFFTTETARTLGRQLYDARAREVDAELGRALQKLESRGLLKNALVVVTSQHGEEFLEHGRLTHSQQLYRESLHVPLIFAFPGSGGGRVVASLAQGVDIMPTILAALGLDIPGGLDGASLLPCIEDPKRCEDRQVLSHWNEAFSVRDKDHVYFRLPKRDAEQDGAVEKLFDRRTDPAELRDLAGRRPKAVARLRSILFQNTDGGRGFEGRWPPDVDKQFRRQLRSTGYW